MAIPIEKFGEDHWSLFAYIECRCVDDGGILDPQHMRAGSKYGTRLRGYFEDRDNPELLVKDHNDWDCAQDLEDAGLIEWYGYCFYSGINPVFRMTKLGMSMAEQLRAHMAAGGHFTTFVPKRD